MGWQQTTEKFEWNDQERNGVAINNGITDVLAIGWTCAQGKLGPGRVPKKQPGRVMLGAIRFHHPFPRGRPQAAATGKRKKTQNAQQRGYPQIGNGAFHRDQGRDGPSPSARVCV